MKSEKLPQESEHHMQVKVFEWAEYAVGQYPELRWMFAVPNGGQRSKAVAGKLKAEGVKSGVCDILLLTPIGPYNGLIVEMKKKPNGVTPQQADFIEYHSSVGYCCVVAYSFEEAKDAIERYCKDAIARMN